jgi:thiamine biosynthesis protein ThiS
MESIIEITLNGMLEKVPPGTTVADLIVRVGENDRNLIVERNNRFVHPHTYPSTIVGEGDRIEMINPDFGG